MFIERGKTKSRTLPCPTLQMKHWRRLKGTTAYNELEYSMSRAFAGTQITESDGNRWPPPKKGPLVDCGSEFFSEKLEVVTQGLPHTTYYIKTPSSYPKEGKFDGSLMANCFNVHNTSAYFGEPDIPLKFNWPPDLSSSRSQLNVKGALAVAACSPGNPIAQTATALGELLQDVPHIPGISLWESRLRAIGTLAAAGDEFLNVVFGINPTLGDMGDFLKAVHKVDGVVDQFIRDAGRVVRRGFNFPMESSTTVDTLPNTFSPVGGMRANLTPSYSWNYFAPWYGCAVPVRETIRTRTTERSIWFSGAFTYHLPDGYDAHSRSDRRKLMAKLFGAEPDLNTLWNLTPWSWAVDWVFDAGTFVKNLQNHISYGTVLRYGYVMETTITTDTFSAGQPVPGVTQYPGFEGNLPPYPVVSPVTLRRTTKKRVQANPFGFGLTWDGMSTTQKAIAAALGITRVVR